MKAASDAGIGGAARRPMRVWLALAVSVLLVGSLVHARILDLSGWWRQAGGSVEDVFEIRQEGSALTFWTVFGTPAEIPPATLVNDTVFFVLGEDTLVFLYANDTLRGNDPDGNPVMFVRMMEGPPWVPIHCGTMTVDGQKSDWKQYSRVFDDPDNDATGGPATEIDRLYMCHDDAYLYVCLELIGDAVFPHSGHNNDRYEIYLKDETHDYSISFWNAYELRFRDNNSGEVIYLGSPNVAVSGRIIEGRVPLSLLNGMSRFRVYGGSQYSHDEYEEWPFYDDLELLGRLSDCACWDYDESGHADLADIMFYINWLFYGGPSAHAPARADVDCNGRINLGDIAYLIRFVYRSGPAPCADCL